MLFGPVAFKAAFFPSFITARALSMPFATYNVFPSGERLRPLGESPK